jgi:hypothetical protein
MITRDFSPIPYKGGDIPFQDLLQGILKNGFRWPTEMKSQEVVSTYLSRSLDNSYTLLCNVSLPGIEVIIPLILIGPPGITVINSSPAKGIYRASGNAWLMMSGRSGSFRPTKPNLVVRTLLFTRALETYLNENGFSEFPVDGVLVLTDPGIHVDTTAPDVRVVLVDGLDRFAAQFSESSPVVDLDRRRVFIGSIERGLERQRSEVTPTQSSERKLSHTIDTGFDQAVKPLRRKLNFSRKQWFVLGAIVIAEVCLLVMFLIIIMITA